MTVAKHATRYTYLCAIAVVNGHHPLQPYLTYMYVVCSNGFGDSGGRDQGGYL